MDKESVTLLDNEIEVQFENLGALELGTEEYRLGADSLTKLLDRQIEMEKLKVEQSNDAKKTKSETIDKVVKNGISLIGVLGGFALTIWGTKKSFEFEKEGSITTIMGRGFINNLLHKK